MENRARRLEEGLKRAQDLARQAPPDLPDPEELEEMEESERERLEAMLEAVTLAGSADQVRQEVQELRRLAAQAQAVEDAGAGGQALGAQGRCSRRKASSITPTSACSSSPSSRTRWTIS